MSMPKRKFLTDWEIFTILALNHLDSQPQRLNYLYTYAV